MQLASACWVLIRAFDWRQRSVIELAHRGVDLDDQVTLGHVEGCMRGPGQVEEDWLNFLRVGHRIANVMHEFQGLPVSVLVCYIEKHVRSHI